MSVVDDVELDAACINEGVETLSELSDCPTCVNYSSFFGKTCLKSYETEFWFRYGF